MTEREVEILIGVLAATDALWSAPRVYEHPTRALPNAAWAAVLERRGAFRFQGVDFTVSGSTDQRKRAERDLGELQSRGLLTIANRSGRRVGVRLTDRGDDHARWLAAAPMRHECWPWLEVISIFVEAGISRNGLVREVDLARTGYGEPGVSGKLADLEMALLPLKAAGLVDDHSDTRGRCWYCLTAAGHDALEGDPPAVPDDVPKYRSAWGEQHVELERRYLAERLTWKPKRSSSVVIPLGAGSGPRKTWRDLLGADRR